MMLFTPLSLSPLLIRQRLLIAFFLRHVFDAADAADAPSPFSRRYCCRCHFAAADIDDAVYFHTLFARFSPFDISPLRRRFR